MSKKRTLALLAVTMAMCGTIGFASACNKQEPAPEPDPPKMEEYNPGDQIIEEKEGEFTYVDGELVGETITGKKVTVKYVISETAYISLSGSKITELKIDGYKGDVTKVSIPDIENSLVVDNVRASVVGVAAGAFYGCETLEEVDLTKENLSLTFEIGNSAFENCTSLTKVKMPENIYTTSGAIGDNAFKNATALTEINLGDKIEKIGQQAFYNCSSLTSISIPKNVTVINAGTFAYCDKLTTLSVDGGANLKSIGNNAFRASGISTLDLGALQSLRFIGSNAFESTGLSAINLPSSVTYIGDGAFYDCKNLTIVKVPFLGNSVVGNQNSYNNTFNNIYGVKGVDARNLTVTIDQAANIPNRYFENGKAIRTLTINSFAKEGAYKVYSADGVSFNRVDLAEEGTSYALSKTVGSYAFNGCENMTSVTLPADLEAIGSSAFVDCINLTSFTVPATVESIGSNAFENCERLSSVKAANATGSYSVNLPNGVKTIGSNAFDGCKLLNSVYVPATIESVGGGAFYGCPVTNLTLGRLDGVREILDEFEQVDGYEYISLTPQNWFDSKTKNSSLTTVTVDSLYAVPNSAFVGLYALRTVKLTFAAVDETPYEEDISSGVAEFTRPAGLPEEAAIGARAFENCSQLNSITINDDASKLTSIGDYAFAKTALTSFTVPETIESLGYGILAGAGNLSSITVERHDFVKSVPSSGGIGESSEKDSLGNLAQKLFSQSSSYSSNTYSANGYYIPYNLSSVTVKGVNTLDSNTFRGWNSLNSITVEFTKLAVGMSNYSATIGSYAFYGCNNAVFTITGGSNVSTINNNAFNGCAKLTTDNYKSFSGVKTIGSYAFGGCKGIEEVILFPTVTSVGNNAFYNCSNVASLHIANFANVRSSMRYLYNIFGYSDANEYNESRGVYVTKYANDLPLALKTLTIAGINSIDDLYYNNDTYRFLSSASMIEVISLDLPAATNVDYKMLSHTGYNPFSDCTSLKKIFLPASYDKLYYESSSSWSNAPFSAVTYTSNSSTPSNYGNYWHYTTDSNYNSVVTEWDKSDGNSIAYEIYVDGMRYPNTAANGVLERSGLFVPELENKKVVAFYTNSSFNGNPVSFPYYSKTYTTLYAKVVDADANLELVSNSYFNVNDYNFSGSVNYTGSYSSYSASYTLRALETGTLTFTAGLNTGYGQITATHYPLSGSSKTVLTINNHYSSYSSSTTENTYTNEYTNSSSNRTVSVQVKAGDTITFTYSKNSSDYNAYNSVIYNVTFSTATAAEPTRPTAPTYTAPATGGYDLSLLLGDVTVSGANVQEYVFNNAVSSYLNSYGRPQNVTAKLVANGMILNAKYDYNNYRVVATSTSLPGNMYIDYSYNYPKVYVDMGGQLIVATDYDNDWGALRGDRPASIDGSTYYNYSEFTYDTASKSFYKVQKDGSYDYVTIITVDTTGKAVLTFAQYNGDECTAYVQYSDVNSTSITWPTSAQINGAIDMGAI